MILREARIDDFYSLSATPAPLCPATATWKREGVTVAGSASGRLSSTLNGLEAPTDLLIDSEGNLFIADTGNDRIVCWLKNATQGYIVAGIGFLGSWNTSLNSPAGLLGQSLLRSNERRGHLFRLSSLEQSTFRL